MCQWVCKLQRTLVNLVDFVAAAGHIAALNKTGILLTIKLGNIKLGFYQSLQTIKKE